MTSIYEIEKFDGTNDFSLWCVRVRAILVYDKIVKTFEGKEALFDKLKDVEKQEALGVIQLSLADEVLREVAHETCPAKLWLKLDSLYADKSRKNRLQLKESLYTLYMTEESSVKDHLDVFNKIIFDLKNIGAEIDGEDQALFLLYSLPSSFDEFVKSMMNGDEISIDDVKIALRKRSQ